MNNPKSTVLGWASLIAAAGVSYYFAKKGINERRAEQAAAGTRPSEKLDWKQRISKDQEAQAQFDKAREDTGNTGLPVKAGSVTNDEVHPATGR
ncbi:hypothetical protein BDW22DRAFT_1425924 [Trametopsis cervina]|nr:hypothetical protein BDW22DRAFT_1425924 [Trametopsis cervina]